MSALQPCSVGWDTAMTPLTRPAPPAPELRPMPGGFALVAPTLSHLQNLRHWQCGETALRRWYREANVRPKPFVPRLLAPQPNAIPHRDRSDAGRAAQHLRRYFPNVYRVDILPARERVGIPAGMFMVAGKGVMAERDLVALAERYGFVR